MVCKKQYLQNIEKECTVTKINVMDYFFIDYIIFNRF